MLWSGAPYKTQNNNNKTQQQQQQQYDSTKELAVWQRTRSSRQKKNS